LRWAAANEGRAATAYDEELKTLFLLIGAHYRDLAEQIDDPEQWWANVGGRQNQMEWRGSLGFSSCVQGHGPLPRRFVLRLKALGFFWQIHKREN